jgi:site-specific recombinase XerD
MKLSDAVAAYVSFKQVMGMCFQSEARTLRSFCRASGDVDLADVDPSSVEAFLAGTGPVTSFWHHKYDILNGLFRFAVNRGYLNVSPLPKTLPKRPEPQKPHIYTVEELRRLLAATDSLATPLSPLQAASYRTLLLTLYGTGLRISEALSLTLADVNLKESLLSVRDSKFFKTRLVATGPRLTGHLRSYLAKRQRLPRPLGQDSAFLATRTGHFMAYDHASKVFRRLRNLAGLHRREGARYAPRLHDIRHSFAVHRLESWYREGADVQRLLPQLSTYLGHVGIAETQRYLTMTPDLLREANKRFERYALGVTNA